MHQQPPLIRKLTERSRIPADFEICFWKLRFLW